MDFLKVPFTDWFEALFVIFSLNKQTLYSVSVRVS